MHGNIIGKRLEALVAGHEIGLGSKLDKHADGSAEVDIGSDSARTKGTVGFFRGGIGALSLKDDLCLLNISFRFFQRFASEHDRDTRLIAKFLD